MPIGEGAMFTTPKREEFNKDLNGHLNTDKRHHFSESKNKYPSQEDGEGKGSQEGIFEAYEQGFVKLVEYSSSNRFVPACERISKMSPLVEVVQNSESVDSKIPSISPSIAVPINSALHTSVSASSCLPSAGPFPKQQP